MTTLTTNTALIPNGTYFVEQMAMRFRGYARKTAENFLDMARVVEETKRVSVDEDFAKFCHLIGVDSKSATIRKYVTMGKQYHFLIEHVDKLPANWTTLYEIARVDEDVIDAQIEAGAITPALTCSDFKLLVSNCKPDHQISIPSSAPLGTNATFHAAFTHKLTIKQRKQLKNVIKLLEKIGAKIQIELELELHIAEKATNRSGKRMLKEPSTATLIEFLDPSDRLLHDQNEKAFSTFGEQKRIQIKGFREAKKNGSLVTNSLEEHFT